MKNEVRIVGTFEYQDGKFVSVDHNRRQLNAHKPVPIPASQIENYYPLKLSSTVSVGNPLNQLTLKPGVAYPGGRQRIIIEATKDKVLFVAFTDAKRNALKTVDVILSPVEKAAILRELEANPGKIAAIFTNMLIELHSTTK